MSLTPSTMQSLGSKAPDFRLPDFEGNKISLGDFRESKVLLIMFICNHCPYVKHIQGELAKLTHNYEDKDITFIGINSNDAVNYPDDSPEKMKEMAETNAWTFPYLIDGDQSVARAYKAACTPDFFLYDADRKLCYRGQLDDSRPGNDIPVTGKDLREAIESLQAGREAPKTQKPSMGCNIKWKPGNEPNYQ